MSERSLQQQFFLISNNYIICNHVAAIRFLKSSEKDFTFCKCVTDFTFSKMTNILSTKYFCYFCYLNVLLSMYVSLWLSVQMASNELDLPALSGDPQPGDLIEIFRPAYQHWALYLGDGYIINLTPVGQ